MSLDQQRAALMADPGHRGHAFAEAWRAMVDHWLVDRFVDASGPEGVDGLALVAVGGYGRGDLAPGSDLDLLLLHRAKKVPTAVAERLWYPIWDEGLKLGHAVRTPGDALALAKEDLDTATSLLTMRHLAGDASLSGEVAADALTQWRRKATSFLATMRDNVSARQDQHGEVAYLLEPDLKQGRGGLRDIHSLRWAELARPVLEDGDVEALAGAERVLFEVRVEVHRMGGRTTEKLRLQDQDGVAAALGTDADALMAAIASAASTVAWIADETWDRVNSSQSAGPSLLGWRSRDKAPGLVVRDGQVEIEPSCDPTQHQLLPLDAAVLAARKQARLSREAHEMLGARAPLPPDRWPTALRERFVDLLAEGHQAIRVIEAMDHTGLWERYVPEWVPVRNHPQRNAYHRFTVDRHLLEATANAAALVDRVSRRDLLLVGALLHDIGKGRPGDHTEVGMELVAEMGPRMGFDQTDTAVLVALVRHHLLLPDAATRRDLSDPTTIESVAAAVGDQERLHLLAALTEADALATGPAAWGAWKAELVRDLVRRVDHLLDGGNPSALPTVEFPDAAQRAVMARGARSITAEGTTITVITKDQRGLFSRVAGVLAIGGLEVRTADAASEHGMAIEQFEVTSRFGSVIAWDPIVAQLEQALDQRLAIDARLADRIQTYRARRAGPPLPPPSVRFDDEASGVATVVEVQAPDRMGLLFHLSRAFAEFDVDVRVAKIQTIGDLVVDSFYVTQSGGRLVTGEDLRRELERALLHAVASRSVARD